MPGSREALRRKAAESKDAKEKERAIEELKRIDDNRKVLQDARVELLQKLEDPNFVKGFGSNGGEEYLSYTNIGETLIVKGGDEWEKWDKKITENLNRVQNPDGSFSGHHCITGRTFCTSAALLVLTIDRAPVPVAAKIAKR